MPIRRISPLLLLAAAACATIAHGSMQKVAISSTPASARVTIDSQSKGTTPFVAELSRKDTHVVKIEVDGYQPFTMTLTKKTSGWVWGNLVFGGVIGIIVDVSNGAMYKLSPEEVTASLTRNGASMRLTRDGVYVTLAPRVESPPPTRIGSLRHIDWTNVDR